MDILSLLGTSAAATLFVGALAWLFRETLSQWLGRSIEHGLDVKLERLRSDIRSKEVEIDALRSGALTNATARQSILFQKRVDAVDRLWAAVNDLNRFTPALAMMATIKFDVASDEVTRDPNVKRMFEMLSQTFAKEELNVVSPQACRPYLSELTWALYSAYLTIIMMAYVKMRALKEGVDARPYFKFKAADDDLKKVLPEYAEFIDKHSEAAHSHLADTLRDRILLELRRTLNGEAEDEATVRLAAGILGTVEAVQREFAN